MKSSQLRFHRTLRPVTIGIYLTLIIVNQSEALRLPLINQVSISWGSNGIDITSSGGASNLTITKDDSNTEIADAGQSSLDERAGKPNQTEMEKSRIPWLPGGLHELNEQIMSEITDARNKADEEASETDPIVETLNCEENDSDEEESVESERDDRVVESGNIGDDDEDDDNARSHDGSGDVDDDDDGSSEDEETILDEDEKADRSPRNGQRGGALVKEAKPKRFQFSGPLETDKVASAASRLINDDSDEGESEQSNGVFAPEISVQIDVHAQEIRNNKAAGIADGFGKAESVSNINLDNRSLRQGILNTTESETKDISAANLTVNLSLEGKNASHSAFRSIRKRTAKLTGMHGFFSQKYSKTSRGLQQDSLATNSTIQQEEDNKPQFVAEEADNNDETIEVKDPTSNQTKLSMKIHTPENKDGPMNSQGTEKLNEPVLADLKKKEKIRIDDTASDRELTREITEGTAESERSTEHAIDSLPAETSPAESKTVKTQRSLYESSGVWRPIDAVLTLGLANKYPSLRTSHYLRGIRKLTAKYTGLHGVLSGKNYTAEEIITSESGNEQISMVRRRLAAIERARKRIPEGSLGIFGRRQSAFDLQMKKNAKEAMLRRQQMERVKEIDRLFADYQRRMMDLVCEKDMLQRRPNPLWNYTSEEEENVAIDSDINDTSSSMKMVASRRFNFPPQDLVDNYLEVLFLSERLVKLNHTDLWRDSDDDDEDEDLSEDFARVNRQRKRSAGGRTSGNWLLRNGLGQKIGEAAEMAAYKSVCKALMSVLARSISSIHGLNVMKYSDIRLSMEHTPGLPPLLAGMIPGSDPSADYAKSALEGVMFRGAKKNKRKRRQHRRKSDFDFLQRGAIVETLLSHAQISAPLLQLFPLAWQRELLSNIITMATTIISDFSEGLEFHILGHRLSFSFTPITEEDMLRGIASDGFNRRRPDPEQYEAAIRATADDLSNELKFLDKWHERALGSDMLRSQIANLIARLVIHLVDDLLRGARLDLWSSHGGPRLVAGLEFRSTGSDAKEQAR